MLFPTTYQLLIVGDCNNCQSLSQIMDTRFSKVRLRQVADYEAATAFLDSKKSIIVFAPLKIKNCSLFNWLSSAVGKDIYWVALADSLTELPKVFEHGGSGFLKCPLNIEQVDATLASLCRKVANLSDTKQKHISNKNKFKKTESTQTNNISIPYSDILFITAKGDYAIAYLKSEAEERIRLPVNLKAAEELLMPKGFFRVHKQYLVNTKYLKNGGEMYSEIGGDVNKKYIRLINDMKVEVARRRRKYFKEFMRKVR